MRSLYDDILALLTNHDFTIPNITTREPYDESPKTYPAIVVHELNNVPNTHATVSGEEKTSLSYQFDIQTQNCVDRDGHVLTRSQAGRQLVTELSDLLDSAFKFTRRSITPQDTAVDVLSTILRGDVVLDSYGYTYRH